MKQMKKTELHNFFQILNRDFQVLVPAVADKTSSYLPYNPEIEIIPYGKTQMSPKSVFFPAMEKMYGFKTKGQGVTIEETRKNVAKKILWAIHSCDAQGILCLDKVFLNRGFEDEFYKTRRAESLIFALACNHSIDSCFCQSMGVDPQAANGADVQVYENDDTYFFKAITEAGKEFMVKYDSFFADGEDFTPTPFQQNLTVDMTGVSEKMPRLFEDPMWDKLGRGCIGCSTCAYLCPTCSCFDLTSKRHGEKGSKFRTWDCCMFDDYTLMAGGHNPRPGQKQRVRNRMMDKLVYSKQRHGEVFCVGCGRCILKCPVNIDITSVINKVKEAE